MSDPTDSMKMLNAPQARQGSVRAVRNNNPGNVERGIKWIGLQEPEKMTPAQRAENRFAVFAHPKYGFRAMATVILTYARKRRAKDGSAIDTIGDVIARWAPPVENDTGAYARAVAKAVGVGVGETVNLEDHAILRPMIKAMSIHEAGGWFFKDADMDEGLRMVGVIAGKPSKTEKREGAVVAATTAVAATGGTLDIIRQASETATMATPALGFWGQLYSAAPTIALVIVVAGLAYLAWRYIRRQTRENA